MRDGDGGQDMLDRYSFNKVSAYEATYGRDCGTAWQLYWRQSLPGFGNTARDAENRSMKNFWPFLFY